MNARRSVELSALLPRLPASTQVNGDVARLITGIELDSRRVRPGALFVALRGEHSDGHDHVAAAIANGALAIVVEEARAPRVPPHVTVIHVPDTRRALSPLAAAYHGDPSERLDVVGVTGTNGKTTTTRMIASILERAGKPCGVIGTVGAELGSRQWKLAHTTPLPPELHGLLAEMLAGGAAAVAMEVSSHALALDRVDDVRFCVAALTNVTRDHLDFHETLEAYAAAKRRLFGMAPVAVLNADDDHGRRWATDLFARGTKVVTYGESASADVRATQIELAPDGSRFAAGGTTFEVRIPGRFNVANALAAIAVARELGVDDAASAQGLAALVRVPGRMEHVRGAGIDVVVDYSHTPDSLENALSSLRETSSGKVAVVFGCGGDRDRGKRPQMGAVAARLADRIYVTNDNPRSESAQAIADAIVGGLGERDYVVELDRRSAIRRAVDEAAEGDVVLIAGKGHEAYQIVGDTVLPFDDVAVAREALQARGAQV
ncbi:MAG: UDP-N-acetylmuramoyl-L-alanyl-D-glutamate--2,6-diaminopimelate ligase [Candidatus Eremiobacteraeota bacterium]|nr:UDP-N-acetylmuramoyl-L-alanyl-D-glutamate--2,6-diaminopimelate ligase [Candidatus Eremiobacteraeota bacterium]